MQRIEIKTTQNVTIEYELASLRDRIIAFLLDLIVVGLVFALLLQLFSMAPPWIQGVSSSAIIIRLAPILLFLCYQFFSALLANGQSLGKKVLNIRVVRLDGHQPSASDHLTRTIFHLVDIIFSSGVLAALFISTSVKRQRLGDMAAHTIVVRTSNRLKFQLSDILKLESPEEYTPTYPQVTQLTDEDMLIIKNTISRYLTYRNRAHQEVIQQLSEKLAGLLGISPQPVNKIEFLQTLLHDYIVLTR